MSTLTSLISAGGGGGSQTHIITDPKLLNRLAARAFSIIVNSGGATTAVLDSFNEDFFINTYSNTGFANTGFSSTVAVTAANTYATLLDTSNADGGYLYWVLGCSNTAANDISSIKITVDGGTPYEIQYTNPNPDTTFRPFLGSGCSTAINNGITSGTMTNANDFWNATTYGFSQRYTARQEDYINGFWSTQGRTQFIVSDMGLYDNASFQKLYFTTSLKIEVKQSNYQITQSRNRAICLYKLL